MDTTCKREEEEEKEGGAVRYIRVDLSAAGGGELWEKIHDVKLC